MKKIFNISFGALAILFLTIACNKDIASVTNPEDVIPAGATVTIRATLSDALTRVSFTPTITSGKATAISLAWAQGDKVRVFDHADRSKYDDFTLAAESVGETVGVFSGSPTHLTGATSYDVEVINVINDNEVTDDDPEANGDFYKYQTQPADGDPGDLKYFAKAKDINDYTDVQFSEISGILAISVKLPAGVAADIKSVELLASEYIFPGEKELTITLTNTGDAGNDDILNLFATLDTQGASVEQPVSFLAHFNAPETAHTVYTRYFEILFPALHPNSLNIININASESDQHAGKTTDDGSQEHPYLIGDKYQLKAMAGLMVNGQTTFFKLIDDIDMDGEQWTRLNPDPFTAAVYLDGNYKTISNLDDSLFQDFNGTARDLTISDASVSSSGELIGIFACTIKTAASTLNNVDIKNSSITSSNNHTGGLVSEIDAPNTTLTGCDVVDTDVTGSRASGMLYFANALVTITECSYSGGTVTGSGQYIGGLIGSLANFNSVISNCRVEDATINSTRTDDPRAGGLVGQSQVKVTIKGCTVGTPEKKVTVNTANPAEGKVLNSGGFIGVNYGKITKNGDVHSKAYVIVKSANTKGQPLHLGGFVGFHRGTIEYSDAIVDMNDLQGQHIGGFSGYITHSSTIGDHCTVQGAVKGNNYTGGFVGYVDNNQGAPSVTNCEVLSGTTVNGQSSVGGFVGYITDVTSFSSNSSAATVFSRGSNAGGFVGWIADGTVSDCYSTGSVSRSSGTGSSFGGFAGYVEAGTIEKCYATGTVDINSSFNGGFIGNIKSTTSVSVRKCYSVGDVVSSSSNVGAFIGIINSSGATVSIDDCYSVGNMNGTNQRLGGFIGQVQAGTVAISRCYASGNVSGSFAVGGLLGFMNVATCTIEDCAAWNGNVTPTSFGAANWSSGAVVGVAWPVATLTNNFRKPDLSIKAYWGNVSGYTKELTAAYDHPDVNSSNPLIVVDKTDGTTLRATTATAAASGQDNYPLFAYHGKHVASGTTLSTLASTPKISGGLGWDSTVWDFSGPLPLLR